jgi:hypothetical protein
MSHNNMGLYGLLQGELLLLHTPPSAEESHEEPYLGDIVLFWDFPKTKYECCPLMPGKSVQK